MSKHLNLEILSTSNAIYGLLILANVLVVISLALMHTLYLHFPGLYLHR